MGCSIVFYMFSETSTNLHRPEGATCHKTPWGAGHGDLHLAGAVRALGQDIDLHLPWASSRKWINGLVLTGKSIGKPGNPMIFMGKSSWFLVKIFP
jgi:hypothetical protein